jgi:FGGY-family pentulose kinase
MFPEMQIPKIMWLKRHLGDRWGEVGSLFDLADFLAWRATGSTTRSLCTLAAKWSYNPAAPDPWPVAMLETCGVPDLPERAGIKAPPVPVGTPIGTLTGAAARDLGLNPGTPVAAGMVDAFAGALGALGADVALPEGTGRATAIVAGTSTAVLCMAREAVQLSGIWGPFRGAIIPGVAVVEGGQSAAGALLDHIIRNHAAGGEPTAERHQSIGRRISELLALEGPDLGGRLHVVPDFLGNRSPLGDPRAMGILWGLTLESDFDSLCRLYWRAAVGLALSLRQILTHLGQIGFLPDLVPIVGGHTRSPVLLQLYADAIGRKVRGPGVQDATLLGTAMAAATGAGLFPTLAAAAGAMHHLGPIKTPRPDYERRFIRDYAAFLALQAHRAEVEDLLPAQ